ncbi:PD40 domain-containing protein [Fibrobacter sp. UWS1]|uniref:TolB family protein n=1 Tax=Fibrobacter sp. UWS1 TaxID=1896220 RepID=UPI000BB13108|nr:PD40 domain-containing protein [Fibrobacter sp. UWS1]PBC68797.1 WD40 repeat protein [Fibrobacter sp. UWS1]
MKIIRTIFASLLFCSFAASAELSFSGNQSEIRWKTATSEHFHYIYPAEYSTHAGRVASAAEAVYDSVVSRYHIDMPLRIHVSIQNALYANGSAVPNENAVNLFLSNWDFKLRSTHPWVTDVITHEFSHLVSIESGSKLPHFLYGLQFSYIDYYNERRTENASLTIPFTLQPLWFAEGTAQFESARMGFDSWDSHRDMILRTAVLNDSLLDLNYMHDFADNSLKAELGPYTQGFSLVRYIDAKYGPKAVPDIWFELSRPYRATLSAALQKVIGIDEDSLYKNWKEDITRHYTKQKEELGVLISGKKWTQDAFYHDFPVVSGGHIYGISNFGGAWFDGDVFKIPVHAQDSITATDSASGISITLQDSILDISQFSDNGFHPEKPWFDKGISVRQIEGRGPVLAYTTFKKRDRHGHAHFDIAIADTNGNNQLVTTLADAVYPDISPDGKEIVFARREPHSTRFVLSKAAIPDSGVQKNEEIQDIFIPDENFLYYNIYTPKFSPDGKKIAFSYFDDAERGIAIIHADGSNRIDLKIPGVDLRDPNWIDNETLIYSSNQTGIFNLYTKKISGGTEHAITNVLGGAFSPSVDSSIVYYINYDQDGFSLYSIPLTDYDATQDSIIVLYDTTYTSCPDTVIPTTSLIPDSLTEADSSKGIDFQPTPDSLNVSKDSLNFALSDSTLKPLPCKIDTIITKRDSIIQKMKNPPLVLAGELPSKNNVHLEFADIEYAGSEKNYKPIPTVLLLAPLFIIQERSPDFTVKGDGQAAAKIGIAMSLSDPLKKNILSAGLLLEVGNGFDYINGDGINPKMEREFSIELENHSTPITLGLSYTNMNYRSKDTVRYEDPRSYEDSIGTSYYSVPLNAFEASAKYSVFKAGDSLFASVGYDWANFNLYEDNLEWTYQKRIAASIGVSLDGGDDNTTSTNTAGIGNGISAVYQFANSDLYRPGSFSESFTISPSGKIEPIYRNYTLHSFYFNMHGSIASPLFQGSRFAFGATVAGLGAWSAKDAKDTLDSYYYTPLLLEGYPYLISTEDYNRSGLKTAKAELHYLFPIFEDFRNSFWIFSTRDLFVNLYAQVGAAWNAHGFAFSKFKKRDFWDRSVGLEFRMANRLFNSLPLNISLNLVRGLDRIGENEFGEGGRKMTPIGISFLPKSIRPTKIEFSIGFDFDNTWMY